MPHVARSGPTRVTALVALVALVALDAAALIGLHPDLRRVAAGLQHPHAWVARAGTDRALAELSAAALWVAALWLAAGLLLTVAGRLPGALGRGAARLAAAVVPRAVQRLVAGTAGLGVLLAPTVAQAHDVPAPRPAAAATVAAATAANPTIAAPNPANAAVSAVARAVAKDTVDPTLPGPRWPSDPDSNAGSNAGSRTGAAVEVAPGDSLWLLAARRLGPGASAAQIAHEWPRWYAVNRAVIGDDPNLIDPGAVLHAPPSHQEQP